MDIYPVVITLYSHKRQRNIDRYLSSSYNSVLLQEIGEYRQIFIQWLLLCTLHEESAEIKGRKIGGFATVEQRLFLLNNFNFIERALKNCNHFRERKKEKDP